MAEYPTLEQTARRSTAEVLRLSVARLQAKATDPSSLCTPGDNGAVELHYSISAWTSISTGEFTRAAEVNLRFVGCFGSFQDAPLLSGSGIVNEVSSSASSSSDANSEILLSALNKSLEAFRKNEASMPDYVRNIKKFGIPLGSNERSAFLAVRFDQDGARVVRIDPRGTAALAGVALGSIVRTLNGQRVTSTNLVELVRSADASGRWELLTDRSDHAFTFFAKDAFWYVAHSFSPEWGRDNACTSR